MNRIYRIVWNATTHSWAVVSELARGHKKAGGKSLLANSILAVISLSSANVLAQTDVSVVIDNGLIETVPGTQPKDWVINGNSIDFTVGHAGEGALQITDGGSVISNGNVVKSIIGNLAGSNGTVTIDGAGSTWSSSTSMAFGLTEFSIGMNGNATLNITNGGMVSSQGYSSTTSIGENAGSTGVVNVDGANSSFAPGNWLRVGYGGNGTLNVTNGATVESPSVDIGRLAGSQGVIQIDGLGSTLTSTSSIGVGLGGTGVMRITNGAKVASLAGFLGGSSGEGQVFIDGAGSLWTAEANVNVGGTGFGSLVITNGGEAKYATLEVGMSANGQVSIDGVGSRLDANSMDLGLSDKGNGFLSVTNGGTLNTGSSIIGMGGGYGVVNVDGQGSTWISNSLSIGSFGRGQLNITRGATVITTADYDSVTIGLDSRYMGGIGDVKTGEVNIDGLGSALTTHSSTYLGISSNGTVNVANGGRLNSGTSIEVGLLDGGHGVINIGAAPGNEPVAPGFIETPEIILGDKGLADINFNHTDNSKGYVFTPSITSGTGMVNVYSGTTVFNGQNVYTGETTIFGGTLSVGDANHSDASITGSDVRIEQSGALSGYGTINGSLANAGLLMPGSASGFDNRFGQLIINGDYAGNNGAVFLNTMLNDGGDLANQKTDRLLISGNASGTTYLHVTGQGAGGNTNLSGDNLLHANEGISLVQVGGSSTADAFQLAGGYIAAGPFMYRLHAFGPGEADQSQNLLATGPLAWDYRLTTVGECANACLPTPDPIPDPADDSANPEVRKGVAPQTGAYVSSATALFDYNSRLVDTLHQRLGEIRNIQVNESASPAGEIFVRYTGSQNHYRSDRNFAQYGYDFDQSSNALQLGGSILGWTYDNSSLRFGVAAQHGQITATPKRTSIGGSQTKYTANGISAWMTWLQDSGFYVDAVLGGDRYNGKVSTNLRGSDIAMIRSGGWHASIEAGYPFAIGHDWTAEPQVQVTYQSLTFSDVSDTDKLDVRLGNASQASYRLGGRVVKSGNALFSPYLRADYIKRRGSHQQVEISSADWTDISASFAGGRSGDSYLLGLGATSQVINNLAIYGEASYQGRVKDYGSAGWTANFGLRWNF